MLSCSFKAPCWKPHSSTKQGEYLVCCTASFALAVQHTDELLCKIELWGLCQGLRTVQLVQVQFSLMLQGQHTVAVALLLHSNTDYPGICLIIKNSGCCRWQKRTSTASKPTTEGVKKKQLICFRCTHASKATWTWYVKTSCWQLLWQIICLIVNVSMSVHIIADWMLTRVSESMSPHDGEAGLFGVFVWLISCVQSVQH